LQNKKILVHVRVQVQKRHEAGILTELAHPPGSAGAFSTHQDARLTHALAVDPRLFGGHNQYLWDRGLWILSAVFRV
jgi:hypothetical protein